MNSIAFLTTIYPGSERYLHDFRDSLFNQTREDFDIVIVNENVDIDFSEMFRGFVTKVIRVNDSKPAKNREIGINYVIENGYDYLIIGDIDDYFSETRVEETIEALQCHGGVINDLAIVNEDKEVKYHNYFQISHNIPSTITLEYIKEKNLCGLSNCGLRVDRIKKVSFPADLKIVDWYLFSTLLWEGLDLTFIPNSLTFYRQYDNNEIGVNQQGVENFRRQLYLKIDVYKHLKDIIPQYDSLYDEYLNMTSVEQETIVKQLNKNKNITTPLWWENIKIQ